MPEISIITPVYQAEKFLKKCVDSILSQSFTDWELLLVDDGSTDKSSEICRTYAEQDARIRYHQKENGGVSSARNAGVALAEGRYITFVDSDDFAAEDLLETLYRLAEKYDAEMSICRGYDLYEGRPVPDLKQEGIESVTDSEEGLRQVMKARVFGVMPWGKLYRRDFRGRCLSGENNRRGCIRHRSVNGALPEGGLFHSTEILLCAPARKPHDKRFSLVRSGFGGSMGS